MGSTLRHFHILVFTELRLKNLLKAEMNKTLHFENLLLHFDGKRIDGQEYQMLVLKNERREI